MFKPLRKFINKKGVSLVEAVIAIAIITGISATAISVSMAATSVYNDSIDRFESRIKADNALSAFQFSDNKMEFQAALRTAGFEMDENNDYIASAYYFKSIKVSNENLNVEFRDNEDRTILTVPDYTSAEIDTLINETSANSKFEKDRTVFKSGQYKAEVDYQKATVRFYRDATIGWMNYYNGKFYAKDSSGNLQCYTVSGTRWTNTGANNSAIIKYQTEAHNAGNEAGNEDGSELDRRNYYNAFNKVLDDAKNEMFNNLKSLCPSFTQANTSFEYTYSPYLQTVEALKVGENRCIEFCDASGLVILAKNYIMSDENQQAAYLEMIKRLNTSGYTEYPENVYNFSANFDDRTAWTYSAYFRYENYGGIGWFIDKDYDVHSIKIDSGARQITAENNSRSDRSERKFYYTFTAGHYEDFGKNGEWVPDSWDWETSPYTYSDQTSFNKAAEQVKSEEDKYDVVVDYTEGTVSVTVKGTAYYYQNSSSVSWSKTKPNYPRQDFDNMVNHFLANTTCTEVSRNGEKLENDPIRATLDYKDKSLTLTDNLNLISNKFTVSEQMLFETGKANFEQYADAYLIPDLSAFNQTYYESEISYDSSYQTDSYHDEETAHDYTVYMYTTSETSTYYKCKYCGYTTSSNNSRCANQSCRKSNAMEKKTENIITVFRIDEDSNNSKISAVTTDGNNETKYTYKYVPKSGCDSEVAEWVPGSSQTIDRGFQTAQSKVHESCGRTVTFDLENKKIYFTVNGVKLYFTNSYTWVKDDTSLGDGFETAQNYLLNTYVHSTTKSNVKTKQVKDETNVNCTAKVFFKFENGSGTVCQKLYKNGEEVSGKTSYYKADGTEQTSAVTLGNIGDLFTAQTNLQNKLSGKNNFSFKRIKGVYDSVMTSLSASYSSDSFVFYNGDARLYESVYDSVEKFKDDQRALYQKLRFFDSGVEYCYDIIRYLGRVELNTANKSIDFIDDIGTKIISLPYSDDSNGTKRFNDAKKRITENPHFTLFTNNSYVIMLDDDNFTNITVDETNKVITYSKTERFLFFKKTHTYFYKGEGTDWSKDSEVIIADAEWESAKQNLKSSYGKSIVKDTENKSIYFKKGKSQYYYNGSGWKNSPHRYTSDSDLDSAWNKIKTEYEARGCYGTTNDFFLYDKVFYSAHINFSKDTSDPEKTVYYINIIDGDPENPIFYESYEDANEFSAIKEAYESTFIQDNNRYTCKVGKYSVEIFASFKSYSFDAAVVSDRSGKQVYDLHYEKG